MTGRTAIWPGAPLLLPVPGPGTRSAPSLSCVGDLPDLRIVTQSQVPAACLPYSTLLTVLSFPSTVWPYRVFSTDLPTTDYLLTVGRHCDTIFCSCHLLAAGLLPTSTCCCVLLRAAACCHLLPLAATLPDHPNSSLPILSSPILPYFPSHLPTPHPSSLIPRRVS